MSNQLANIPYSSIYYPSEQDGTNWITVLQAESGKYIKKLHLSIVSSVQSYQNQQQINISNIIGMQQQISIPFKFKIFQGSTDTTGFELVLNNNGCREWDSTELEDKDIQIKKVQIQGQGVSNPRIQVILECLFEESDSDETEEEVTYITKGLLIGDIQNGGDSQMKIEDIEKLYLYEVEERTVLES